MIKSLISGVAKRVAKAVVAKLFGRYIEDFSLSQLEVRDSEDGSGTCALIRNLRLRVDPINSILLESQQLRSSSSSPSSRHLILLDRGFVGSVQIPVKLSQISHADVSVRDCLLQFRVVPPTSPPSPSQGSDSSDGPPPPLDPTELVSTLIRTFGRLVEDRLKGVSEEEIRGGIFGDDASSSKPLPLFTTCIANLNVVVIASRRRSRIVRRLLSRAKRANTSAAASSSSRQHGTNIPRREALEDDSLVFAGLFPSIVLTSRRLRDDGLIDSDARRRRRRRRRRSSNPPPSMLYTGTIDEIFLLQISDASTRNRLFGVLSRCEATTSSTAPLANASPTSPLNIGVPLSVLAPFLKNLFLSSHSQHALGYVRGVSVTTRLDSSRRQVRVNLGLRHPDGLVHVAVSGSRLQAWFDVGKVVSEQKFVRLPEDIRRGVSSSNSISESSSTIASTTTTMEESIWNDEEEVTVGFDLGIHQIVLDLIYDNNQDVDWGDLLMRGHDEHDHELESDSSVSFLRFDVRGIRVEKRVKFRLDISIAEVNLTEFLRSKPMAPRLVFVAGAGSEGEEEDSSSSSSFVEWSMSRGNRHSVNFPSSVLVSLDPDMISRGQTLPIVFSAIMQMSTSDREELCCLRRISGCRSSFGRRGGR